MARHTAVAGFIDLHSFYYLLTTIVRDGNCTGSDITSPVTQLYALLRQLNFCTHEIFNTDNNRSIVFCTITCADAGPCD